MKGYFSFPPHPDRPWSPPSLLEVKRPGRAADHTPPSSVEIKKAWSHISTLPIRLRDVVLN